METREHKSLKKTFPFEAVLSFLELYSDLP